MRGIGSHPTALVKSSPGPVWDRHRSMLQLLAFFLKEKKNDLCCTVRNRESFIMTICVLVYLCWCIFSCLQFSLVDTGRGFLVTKVPLFPISYIWSVDLEVRTLAPMIPPLSHLAVQDTHTTFLLPLRFSNASSTPIKHSPQGFFSSILCRVDAGSLPVHFESLSVRSRGRCTARRARCGPELRR